MASGDTLLVFGPLSNEPPASAYATLDTRYGRPCLDFSASATEQSVFSGVLPRNYDGGGLTVQLVWASSTDQTSDGVRWDAQIERVIDDTTDADADDFAAVQSVTDTAPSAVSEIVYCEIAFTSAQMDGLVAGEHFRMRIQRDHDHAGDTMAGDAELFSIEIRET